MSLNSVHKGQYTQIEKHFHTKDDCNLLATILNDPKCTSTPQRFPKAIVTNGNLAFIFCVKKSYL